MHTIERIKKPIEAIQCSNNFSLLQRKMYNVLLVNAANNPYMTAIHRISMNMLCELMGYNSHDYENIKQNFKELHKINIEWDIINENKRWPNTAPLSLARVIEGQGVCEYEFPSCLIPFLERTTQYAKFSLAIQAKFNSIYGLALYENCERYRALGHTKKFSVATFRKLMGIGEEEYRQFFALKRRVINTAMKEVNQYADFHIEVEYEKKGRLIISLKFIIKKIS